MCDPWLNDAMWCMPIGCMHRQSGRPLRNTCACLEREPTNLGHVLSEMRSPTMEPRDVEWILGCMMRPPICLYICTDICQPWWAYNARPVAYDCRLLGSIGPSTSACRVQLIGLAAVCVAGWHADCVARARCLGEQCELVHVRHAVTTNKPDMAKCRVIRHIVVRAASWFGALLDSAGALARPEFVAERMRHIDAMRGVLAGHGPDRDGTQVTSALD